MKRRKKLHSSQLTDGRTPTEEVSEARLLSVLLDNSISWSSHISQLCNKIIGTSCMLRRIVKYMPEQIFKQISQALIHSQINYCSVVWSNASVGDLKRMQIAQNKEAVIILQCGYERSSIELHNALEWLTQGNSKNNILIPFCQIHHSERSNAIHDKLDMVKDKHSRNTQSRTKPTKTQIRL